MKNGIGYYFFYVGILFFCLMFHCKLHSLQDLSSGNARCNKLLKMYSIHSLIAIFLLVLYVTLRLFYLSEDFHEKENILIDDHIFYLVNMTLFCIILPKYYINQIPNLKLYVSVYSHQPPPVFSWQLPHNFDKNSVDINIVECKNE